MNGFEAMMQNVSRVPHGTIEGVEHAAHFSKCRLYRYELWRKWSDTGYVMFIGLNPSTADEFSDDPTVRRCIDFARSFGGGGLCMTNIFAWRDTDPKAMKRAAEPIGAENDETLMRLAKDAKIVIAAWGVHGEHQGRAAAVLNMLCKVCRIYCLGVTKDHHPKHPLYLPKNAELQIYVERS